MISFLISIPLFFLAISLLGLALSQIKVPRIFASLFLGVLLSFSDPVKSFTSSSLIQSLSWVGMIFLPFLIGFNLNIGELTKQKALIVKTTFWIILTESIVGFLLLRFLFHVEWMLAGLIAISFTTIGEVVLLPILKEFNLVKTKLGQTILGVGVLDDVVEVLAFILLALFISDFRPSELFGEMLPVLAILVGVAVGNLLKGDVFSQTNKVLSFLALSIFGPFFFFHAGMEAGIEILVKEFFLILLLTFCISGTKMVTTYLISHKELGRKKSIVLGLGVSVKFSTSIIILMILLRKNLIDQNLFAILIGTSILFKFIIPVSLSYFMNKWRKDLV